VYDLSQREIMLIYAALPKYRQRDVGGDFAFEIVSGRHCIRGLLTAYIGRMKGTKV